MYDGSIYYDRLEPFEKSLTILPLVELRYLSAGDLVQLCLPDEVQDEDSYIVLTIVLVDINNRQCPLQFYNDYELDDSQSSYQIQKVTS